MTDRQTALLLSYLERIAISLEALAPSELDKKASREELIKIYGIELVSTWEKNINKNPSPVHPAEFFGDHSSSKDW